MAFLKDVFPHVLRLAVYSVTARSVGAKHMLDHSESYKTGKVFSHCDLM
jgi:hypothetical protein